MPRLSDRLGVEVWAKRDDCNSGLAGNGGNKTRKLEFLVADALAQGCDTLVTVGGVQSNHTRQVAAAAAAAGLDAVLVQGHWVNIDEPSYDRVGNLLLSRICGASIQFTDDAFDIGMQRGWDAAVDALRQRGRRPYAIPAGASDHPLGGLGYAAFVDELVAQEMTLGLAFDWIVVASGTGSTQAGMIAGLAAHRRDPRSVIGVDITAAPTATRAAVTRIAQRTSELLAEGRAIAPDDVVLDERFAAPAYGIPSTGTLDAIRLAGRLEGILVDPVYEGKSLHALVELAGEGRFTAGDRVLYAHLGGSPALHAYSTSVSAGGS